MKVKSYLNSKFLGIMIAPLLFVVPAEANKMSVSQVSTLTRAEALSQMRELDTSKGFYVKKEDFTLRFGGFIKLDAFYDLDGRQPGNPSRLDATVIPLKKVDFDAKRRGNFNMVGSSSRLEVEAYNIYGDIPTHAFFSTDFIGRSSMYSSSYTPRVREAYAEVGGFLIGQTFYTFQDFDAFINTLDNGYGPGRQPMVRYWHHFSPSWSLAVSAETPNTAYYQQAVRASSTDFNGYLDNDSSNGHGQSDMPDAAFKLLYKTDQGHFSLRGVARDFVVKTSAGTNEALKDAKRHAFGWGIGVGAAYKLSPSVKLQLQVNGGKGIGRYLEDMDLGAPLEAYFQYPAGLPLSLTHFQSLKMYQFIAGITVNWSEKWVSAAAASYTGIKAPKNVPQSITLTKFHRRLERYVANLMYQVLPNSTWGFEVLHYRRKAGVHTTHKGKDTRLLTSFIYRF